MIHQIGRVGEVSCLNISTQWMGKNTRGQPDLVGKSVGLFWGVVSLKKLHGSRAQENWSK